MGKIPPEYGQFAAVLGEIYDAALDPSRWQALTERLAHLFDGVGVLFAQDSRSPAATVFSTAGIDAGFLDSYIAHYAGVNIWTPAVAALPVGAVVTNDDVAERRRFERSEWRNDWLRPQDLYHGTACVLGKADGVVTEFSIMRPEKAGVMSPEQLDMLRLLVPHLQRAIRVHQELSTARVGLHGALAGFERLATAALIVDQAARVLFANAAAEQLLRGNDGLRGGRNGVLRAGTPPVTERLHALIAGAARTAGLRGADPGGTLPLPRREGRPLVALVSPLRTEPAGLGFAPLAALVLARDPDRAPAVDTEALRALYGLTRAEAAVVAELANGCSAEAIAARGDNSIETVRTHLKRSMAKMGVGRQAELVALVLRNGGPGGFCDRND
ncbi:MAG: hypothetical protein J0H14_17095 [Alphaproteobacteria bacterium]|nr:hypothetical protein [Alphaproteobacteria bacterium]